MNLLLLRGLARQKKHWGTFVQDIKNLCPSINEVFTLDHIGTGDFANISAPFSVRKMTQFLQTQWRTPSHSPTIVCGLSLGAMVALDWLEFDPGTFKGAIMMNTSSKDSGPFYKRITPYALKVFGLSAARLKLIEFEKAILKVTSNANCQNPQIIDEWMSIALETSMPHKTIAAQLFAASQYTSPKSLTTPLLFLNSDKDKMVNPQCSEYLAQKYNSPLNSHSKAGHDLPLDDPAWVCEKIENFAQSLKNEEPQP